MAARHLRTQQASLEEADADLDDIRYDLADIRRKLSGLKERLERVRSQLQMTDYEEIRETLDHCVQRLSQIPAEKEQAVSSQATLRARITQKQKEDRDNAAKVIGEPGTCENSGTGFSRRVRSLAMFRVSLR